MSNVLIGIIGVILFIGLALAGALFLGPRFQETTNNSRAAAMVQSTSQIARALDMRVVSTGQSIGDNQREILPNDILVTEGYLKTMPVNPYSGQPTMLFYEPTSADPSSVPGNRKYFVEMFMPSDATAASVCLAASRQAGGGTTIPTLRPQTPTGCFKDPDGNHRIFARL